MKLTYIHHSGLAIESENITVIIDYFKDSDDDENKGIVHQELLTRDKKLYVLSTHSHYDHFNSDILKWKNIKEGIVYIFSQDILDEKKAKKEDAIYLNKLETYKDDTLEIKAFGSTDLGISFLIKVDGKTIFHAGDLNNWHWNEESTEEEIKEAEDFYQRELDIICNEVQQLDFAIFPIDPGLGKDFMKGATQLIEAIAVKNIAPMHFHEQYDTIKSFEPICEKRNTKYICWKRRGEYINL